jgi:hypothetical protein
MTTLNILAYLVAALATSINVQQYFLAREKFKLDLFEKRFLIFKAVETFLNDAVRDHHITFENLIKFDRDTQIASFLFEDDIVTFLEELRSKGNQLSDVRNLQSTQEGGSPERIALGKKREAILEEFIEIHSKLKVKFSRYLKFKKWKMGFWSGIFN